MKTKNHVYVLKNSDGSWRIQMGQSVYSAFPTQREAAEAGRGIANYHQADLIIQSREPLAGVDLRN